MGFFGGLARSVRNTIGLVPRAVKGAYKGTSGLARLGQNTIGFAASTARTVKGAPGLGLAALLPGKAGGLKYAIPAVGLGLYGLGQAAYGLVGGAYSPYSMNSPDISYDGAQTRFGAGTYIPYSSTPMQFGTFKRSYLDYNATGSLMFGLHNRR